MIFLSQNSSNKNKGFIALLPILSVAVILFGTISSTYLVQHQQEIRKFAREVMDFEPEQQSPDVQIQENNVQQSVGADERGNQEPPPPNNPPADNLPKDNNTDSDNERRRASDRVSDAQRAEEERRQQEIADRQNEAAEEQQRLSDIAADNARRQQEEAARQKQQEEEAQKEAVRIAQLNADKLQAEEDERKEAEEKQKTQEAVEAYKRKLLEEEASMQADQEKQQRDQLAAQQQAAQIAAEEKEQQELEERQRQELTNRQNEEIARKQRESDAQRDQEEKQKQEQAESERKAAEIAEQERRAAQAAVNAAKLGSIDQNYNGSSSTTNPSGADPSKSFGLHVAPGTSFSTDENGLTIISSVGNNGVLPGGIKLAPDTIITTDENGLPQIVNVNPGGSPNSPVSISPDTSNKNAIVYSTDPTTGAITATIPNNPIQKFFTKDPTTGLSFVDPSNYMAYIASQDYQFFPTGKDVQLALQRGIITPELVIGAASIVAAPAAIFGGEAALTAISGPLGSVLAPARTVSEIPTALYIAGSNALANSPAALRTAISLAGPASLVTTAVGCSSGNQAACEAGFAMGSQYLGELSATASLSKIGTTFAQNVTGKIPLKTMQPPTENMELLGSGFFGSAYYDPASNTVVKIFGNPSDAEISAQYTKLTEIGGKYTFPKIEGVFPGGYRMEYIPGQRLGTMVENSKFSITQEAADDFLSNLQRLHRDTGMTHGDIGQFGHLNNIIVTPDGKLRMIDPYIGAPNVHDINWSVFNFTPAGTGEYNMVRNRLYQLVK